MESEKKKRPPNFRLEIPGDENYKIVIQEKLQIVKNYLTRTLKKPGIVTLQAFSEIFLG